MNIFKQKFPCTYSVRSHFITGLSFGVFVMIFLWFFKPFELDTLKPAGRIIKVCAIYGLSTFACITGQAIILPRLFPSFFDEEKWTTGKQILIIAFALVLIGLVNYAISPLMVNVSHSFSSLLWFQGTALTVGLLPITLYILIRQNSLLRKFEQQAGVLEKKLQERSMPANKPEPLSSPEKKNDFSQIELTGDYQGENLVLSPADLFYISAANNYIKVFYLKNEKISYSIIRMTMKKAEDSLARWSEFFRCHRAYIINLEKVAHVEGNAQGYKLRLHYVEASIPVSRNLSTEFSDRLFAMHSYSNSPTLP